jgi:hypothetical protein
MGLIRGLHDLYPFITSQWHIKLNALLVGSIEKEFERIHKEYLRILKAVDTSFVEYGYGDSDAPPPGNVNPNPNPNPPTPTTLLEDEPTLVSSLATIEV